MERSRWVEARPGRVDAVLLQSAKYQLGEAPYLRKHEGTCCAPTSPGLMPEILPLASDFSGSRVLKEASLDQQHRPGSG